MVIEAGETRHIMYRSLYEKSTRRHFVGEVVAAKDSLCRLRGIVFIYDDKKTEFIRKEGERITIIDIAESGVIANVIDPATVIEEVVYKYAPGHGLVATDGKSFSLSINEFGSRS